MAKTIMSRTPNDLAKLPRWAQDTIAALERALSKAKEENAVLRGTADYKDTRVFLWNPSAQDIPLPPETQVVFRLGEDVGDYFQVGFEYARDLPRYPRRRLALQVRTGNGRLAIYADAANSIHVKTEEF